MSAEANVASLPEGGPPPLSVLLQAVRGASVSRVEVDALLAGLSQPPPSEHTPRQHADLLLALIQDNHLGTFTGSDGRTVRAVAIEALVALGYPYALEVPPEALEQKEGRAGARSKESLPSLFDTGTGKVGLALIVLIGLAELLLLLYFWRYPQPDPYLPDGYPDSHTSGTPSVSALVLIAFTTVIPAWLMELGSHPSGRGLRTLGKAWLTLVGLIWLALGLLTLRHGPAEPVPFIIGSLTVLSAVLMDFRKS
ncbi:hypothetical protein [Hyalangium rubrum]|uniref:Uncharacterized protein n=1 Tax=Hyalangium rubrum TaxID=3103134 RepID=A0ABU5H871_9BACT|nr:hypothetical protein [Hyalangium sp. s54d21]MDY7229671.1 hypothetical protein [Hyalangium sp. s54d21]